LTNRPASSRFQRFLLPAFAFKAVVIGGGYATGRELAEFFLPSGPWGGLAAMILAMILWSLICALTFEYARLFRLYDYRNFFRSLLGRGWIVFEIAYVLSVVLFLAVFGAAAGEILASALGVPRLVGTIGLTMGIALFAAYGNNSVEALFKYVSFLLYGIYAIFLILAITTFGDDITAGFALSVPGNGWQIAGVTYAAYNVLGAAMILPVVRHLTSRRDAVVSGLISGPVAMLPAILFFVAMVAFYPTIMNEAVPSDFMLKRLNQPIFHVLFQIMIFAALLECGTGSIHALNERIAVAWADKKGVPMTHRARGALSLAILITCIFVAERVGFVSLIGSGYRIIAYVVLMIYVLPIATIGILKLYNHSCAGPAPVGS